MAIRHFAKRKKKEVIVTSVNFVKSIKVTSSYLVNHLLFFLLGYYSPDGKTEGCVWCPDGTSTKGTGATSLDQCSGIVTVLLTTIQLNMNTKLWGDQDFSYFE